MTESTTLLSATFSTSLMLWSTSAIAQATPLQGGNNDYWGPGMMWGSGQWGGFGMVLGPIFMVLILIGIVGGVLFVFRAIAGPSPSTREDSTSSAIAILNERYARGEIDIDEFQERKKQLRG